MIDRVSILEISKFHFFTRIAELATRAYLQLILYCLDTIDHLSQVHVFCFGRYFGEEHILHIMIVLQCVLCELMLRVFYVSWR